MMVGKSFVLLRVLFYPLPLTVHGERLMFLCLLSIHALSVHPLTSVPHDVISLHLVAQVITMWVAVIEKMSKIRVPVRPSALCVKGLHFNGVASRLTCYNYQTLNLPAHSAVLQQKYIRGWVLGWL